MFEEEVELQASDDNINQPLITPTTFLRYLNHALFLLRAYAVLGHIVIIILLVVSLTMGFGWQTRAQDPKAVLGDTMGRWS